MSGLQDQIEEAQAKVAQCRIRAERPGSRLEDDYALEKARNRLLTLELRLLKQGKGQAKPIRTPRGETPATSSRRPERKFVMGTKREHIAGSTRERAEAAFAALQTNPNPDKEGSE